MSQKEKVFSRKQLLVIFKIAFLEAMALSLIIPTISSTGETTFNGCTTSTSIVQCGTASCTPTNTVPALSCQILITFSPAFAVTPKFATAQVIGCHTPECHFETQAIPQGSVSFQSDNGETWVNMPVAKTEIYGTPNHEVGINTSNNMNQAVFTVNCLTGSTSATAILRPEYSIDDGVTWNELAQNTGFLDIKVDASDCSFASSTVFTTSISGIASAAVGVSGLILRVVGINGNGIGDNVTFNNVQLIFYGSLTDLYTTCIPGSASFICPAGSPISKTSMTINILRLAPATSGQDTAISVNWFVSE